MSIYDTSPAHTDAARKHINDPDWCPLGGTSTRRYTELAQVCDGAFAQEFARRVAARDRELWVKNSGALIDVGWRDDPGGIYSVSHGLVLENHVPEHLLRSVCHLSYFPLKTDGSLGRPDLHIGHHYFEPPYTNDAILRVTHVMAWLDAHHRTHTATSSC